MEVCPDDSGCLDDPYYFDAMSSVTKNRDYPLMKVDCRSQITEACASGFLRQVNFGCKELHCDVSKRSCVRGKVMDAEELSWGSLLPGQVFFLYLGRGTCRLNELDNTGCLFFCVFLSPFSLSRGISCCQWF